MTPRHYRLDRLYKPVYDLLMQTIRISRIAVAAIAATLLMAAVAPAADAPSPKLNLTASITPSKNLKPGQIIKTLRVKGTLAGANGGLAPTITKTVIDFPAGAATNGRLFPSCSVARLKSHHNALSACPKGSKIGSGKITATAVELGVSSDAVATLFNGPGGRSVVFNFHATVPADINDSINAPLVKKHGKYSYELTLTLPRDLQEILDGVFVAVQKIDFPTGATRVINGRTRGYIEAGRTCPKHGAPFHAKFFFLDGSSATSDSQVKFSCAR
jgi:hypothetical protein